MVSLKKVTLKTSIKKTSFPSRFYVNNYSINIREPARLVFVVVVVVVWRGFGGWDLIPTHRKIS
jgi:hypothetical protein